MVTTPDVGTLRNKSDAEFAEWLAYLFNGISAKYSALDLSRIPKTFDRQLPVLAVQDVENQIKNMKKVTSSVPGDFTWETTKGESLQVTPPYHQNV